MAAEDQVPRSAVPDQSRGPCMEQPHVNPYPWMPTQATLAGTTERAPLLPTDVNTAPTAAGTPAKTPGGSEASGAREGPVMADACLMRPYPRPPTLTCRLPRVRLSRGSGTPSPRSDS